MFDAVVDLERVFDRILRVRRTRVRHGRLALVATIGLVGAAWAGPVARAVSDDPAPASAARYVVREGDSLWSIAERLSPGSDPRPLVDAIQLANDVDPGTLIPGRTLLVPVG